MKTLTVGILTALAAMLPLAAQAAPAKAASRISPAQAEAAATAKIPGKALSAKYEFEDGHWQYGVLVKKGAALYEVEVDASTGRVTDTEKTTPGEEAREAAADKKAAMKSHQHSHAKPAAKKGEAGEKGKTNESDEKGS